MAEDDGSLRDVTAAAGLEERVLGAGDTEWQ